MRSHSGVTQHLLLTLLPLCDMPICHCLGVKTTLRLPVRPARLLVPWFLLMYNTAVELCLLLLLLFCIRCPVRCVLALCKNRLIIFISPLAQKMHFTCSCSSGTLEPLRARLPLHAAHTHRDIRFSMTFKQGEAGFIIPSRVLL